MQEKQHIRQKLLEKRVAIPEKEYIEKSARICGRLQELSSYKKAKVVHCYVSMNERREVNTHLLIKEMIAAGKKVVVPITQIKAGTLRHVELTSFEALQKNKWGVLEPDKGKAVLPEKLDFVIVPMAGGDLKKNRIGYGKGFYDRFLKHVNGIKIGLLFDNCLAEAIPTEPFDVPLDMLITEKQVIN